MLRELSIRDFVIVSELHLSLAPGFNVLTGETGAGKSILIDALDLVLGGRAQADVIRTGATRAEISAIFEPSSGVSDWLQSNDLTQEDELLVRRIIDAQGKSRAYVNGSLVSLTQLRELAEHLVDIHGQHMHQSLLKSDKQRQLLDEQSALNDQLLLVRDLWTTWQGVREQLRLATEGAEQLAQKREQLSWQLEDLEKLAPAADEWDQISQEHTRLSHGQALIEGASRALGMLEDDDSGAQRIVDVALESVRQVAKHDPRLDDITESLASASAAVSQARSDLSRYVSALDLDPERMASVEQRLQALFDMGRKYRREPAELALLWEQTQQALAALNRSQDLAQLSLDEQTAGKAYEQAAAKLTKRRQQGAKKLSEAVTQKMQLLGMPGGRFTIAVEAGTPGALGTDKITFMVAGHEGVEPAPLSKVASGGELSRIALALSVTASETALVPTLIFDEVDSGVSGAVAQMVGTLLKELGQRHQVLCVTHLPQVAACASQHYRVSKRKQANGTVGSEVQQLDQDSRVQAIAELLGGIKISNKTLEHAKELLLQLSS